MARGSAPICSVRLHGEALGINPRISRRGVEAYVQATCYSADTGAMLPPEQGGDSTGGGSSLEEVPRCAQGALRRQNPTAQAQEARQRVIRRRRRRSARGIRRRRRCWQQRVQQAAIQKPPR